MLPHVAIIGVGGFGGLYLDHLIPRAEKKELNLTAAVVRNPDKYPEAIARLSQVHCAIFPDTASMYRNCPHPIDIVAIPSGIDSHCAYTTEALLHDCNVMVEKPAAGTVEEVQTMMNAEKNSRGKWVMVGFQHIYSPEIQELKRRLVSGEFGKIRKITAMGCWPRPDSYYTRNNWAGKRKTASGAIINDSPANNAFAHYLNIGLFLAGSVFERSAEPTEVTSKLFRTRPIETFDTCDIFFETRQKIPIRTLFTHACSEAEHPKIKIICEKAVIVWALIPYLEGSYQVYDAKGNLLEESRVCQSFESEFDTMVQKYRSAETFVCTLNEALSHTMAIELLHRDMQVVDLPQAEFSVDAQSGQRSIFGIRDHFNQEFERSCEL